MFLLKFIFSKKATKFDEIFTVDLTLCSKCQFDGEDFVNFCCLLRKNELYITRDIKIQVGFLEIPICEFAKILDISHPKNQNI